MQINQDFTLVYHSDKKYYFGHFYMILRLGYRVDQLQI